MKTPWILCIVVAVPKKCLVTESFLGGRFNKSVKIFLTHWYGVLIVPVLGQNLVFLLDLGDINAVLVCTTPSIIYFSCSGILSKVLIK